MLEAVLQSGLWDSNPRLRPWEGRALPTELSPRGTAPSQRFADARKRSPQSALTPGSGPFLGGRVGIVAGEGGMGSSLSVGRGGVRSCRSAAAQRPKVGPVGPEVCRDGAPARAVPRGAATARGGGRSGMCPPWTGARASGTHAPRPRSTSRSLGPRAIAARKWGEVYGPRSVTDQKLTEFML